MLNAAGDEFFNDPAHLLGLEEDEDSSHWEPPGNSTSEWLEQTSQLWMDSLIDDLATIPIPVVQTPSCLPLPKLEEYKGGDEGAHPDTLSSTPCPSELWNNSPSIDQEEHEQQHSGEQQYSGGGGDPDEVATAPAITITMAKEERARATARPLTGAVNTTPATTKREEEDSTAAHDHHFRQTNSRTGGAEGAAAAAVHSSREDRSNSDNIKEDVGMAPHHREVGHELVNLLLACAEAVSTKSLSLVNPLFAQLGELASPEGTSMQRVAAYFTEGLAIRCSHLWPHIYQPLPFNLDLSEEDSLSAFHILNHVCPYVKFAHFTANDIILQAFEGCDRVHVIDFDIKQGLQWPALFQSLADRAEGPPSNVRVTGIGEYKEDVQDTGDRLAEFAEALDLPFEFHAVIDKLEDVRLWMLHVKEKETVAVNCVLQLHRTLHDSQSGVKDILSMITSTKPKVVAVVEQEACHNGQFFEGQSPRFLEALQYYAAIFDSLDLNMPLESRARMKVEQFFAREIRNILACEGPERVERHEGIQTWRLHMGRGGFKSVPLGKRAKTQARLLLEMFACKNYTIIDDGSVLTLGWRSRPLFTASAWALEL